MSDWADEKANAMCFRCAGKTNSTCTVCLRVAAALREAVEKERERCAAIAYRERQTYADAENDPCGYCYDACDKIATDIESGTAFAMRKGE